MAIGQLVIVCKKSSWCLPMSGNLGLVRLGRADKLRSTRMDGADFAVFKNEDFSAPVNCIVSKAGKPDPERDKITNRQEPETAPHCTIMHDANSYF